MSTLAAIEITNALVTVALNGLIAAQKYNSLIQKAHAEGREITLEELSVLKDESSRLTQEVLEKLG